MAKEDPIESKAYGSNYEPIHPQIREWPIAQFYQNKKENLEEVINRTMEKMNGSSPTVEDLEADLAKTYYSEMQRITKNPWRVDKADEKEFWNSLKKDTNSIDADASEQQKIDKYKEASRLIVERYANEISATFDPQAYHFAKRFLSFGFTTLLNGLQARNLKALFDHRIFIQDRIRIFGEIEKIRSLAKKGTIVLLPTHFSNLDSIILGWGIHAIGLPAFIYGAGLNLFNSKTVGYFMNRLGAYKVDRRKKNPYYLETLKMFSTVSLEKGCHSLFFPGGTRSRSGAIEEHLKLGLLSTAFEAQRNLINKEESSEENKIFVVPLVMSYHFVLEAKSLIKQFLRSENVEQYYFNKDEFTSKKKVTSFIFQLLRKRSSIYLSFGEPTDLFGNHVDEEGRSINNGQVIDIKDYFRSEGNVKKDSQRDGVYTKQLGDTIVNKFLETNIVLSSHVVAHVAYQYYLKKFSANDFFDLTEIDKKELEIPKNEIYAALRKLQAQLFELEKQGKLKISEPVKFSVEELCADGIKNVGVFHNKKPLAFTKSGDVLAEDLSLLYYYHNRLNGYDFERFL